QRFEARPRREEPTVLVAAAVALLDAREVEERLGEIVPDRTLAALDGFPRVGTVRDVVAESELGRTDRVQHPTRAPLDLGPNHGRTTRAQCTSAGFGSSRAHIASTYGGRCSAGRAFRANVIAHRLPSPFMRTGAGRSPIVSEYAMRAKSTPHAAASPCHSHRR